MSAELTATMLVWPRPCGHGGVVLELLEHFTPFWVCRRGGRSVTARVPTRERVLVTGLALACPGRAACDRGEDYERWANRRMTLLRYRGCVLADEEIKQARHAGLHIEVVDIDGTNRTERSTP